MGEHFSARTLSELSSQAQLEIDPEITLKSLPTTRESIY